MSMSKTCPRCGKEVLRTGAHVNLGYQRTVAVFECMCGMKWYDLPTDIEIAGRFLGAGRWESDSNGGWKPYGSIAVNEEKAC